MLGRADVAAQIYWGYSDNIILNGIGIGQNTTVSGAIYIPSEVAELYKGKKATAVRVGLYNSVSELKVFITEDLDGTPETEKTFGSQKTGVASFSFDDAYVISGKGFYVGYSCVGINPIGRSSIYNVNGCWVKDGDNAWIDYAGNEEYKYNALNIAVRIEGEDLPEDARLIVNNETLVKPGEGFKLTAKLENLSTKAIKGYKVEYNIDNGETQTIEKTTYLTGGSSTSFSIDVPAINEFGMHTVNMKLVSVNGIEDANPVNNDVVAYIKVTENSFVRRMVVEEGTGTWCGWCPKGIVAFEYMDEKYPDTFIGIAAHDRDVFSEDTYAPIQNYFDSYPNCIINRDQQKVCSPLSGNLESEYKNLVRDQAVASMVTSANLEDNVVHAKVTATFANPGKDLDYRIAFVILEDSITGVTQANAYAGGANGEMGGFENLPNPAPIKFNHVARGIFDYNGIENSMPSEVEVGEFYDFTKDIELPRVQSTKYLSIVALLINGKTGIIDNAAKAHIETGATDIRNNEITNVSIYVTPEGTICCSEEGKLEVFNLQGIQVPGHNLTHGVYIVKHTSESGQTTMRKIRF